MISCDSFRARFQASTDEAELLDHLRSCDRCLDFAASVDPDVVFRSLGGEALPPGGVDAFVDDVMRQVRVRGAESTVTRANVVHWPRRLAIAATLVAGISGAMLFTRWNDSGKPNPAPVMTATLGHSATTHLVSQRVLATKPVVESYQSENATIVEVPSAEASDDVKIVMIFDENLPADL